MAPKRQGGKKGKNTRKRRADAFEKKRWFSLRIPRIRGMDGKKNSTFKWLTPANKTARGIIVEDRLRDRVCEIRLADLCTADENDEAFLSTKILFRIAGVDGDDCLLDLHGLELTRDKQCSLIKKKISIIEANVDIKSSEGYTFRVFLICFTKKQMDDQVKETAYPKSSQIKNMRKKMIECVQEKLQNSTWQDAFEKIITQKLEKDVEKHVKRSYSSIRDLLVRKVKLLDRPKEDQKRIQAYYEEQAEPEM